MSQVIKSVSVSNDDNYNFIIIDTDKNTYILKSEKHNPNYEANTPRFQIVNGDLIPDVIGCLCDVDFYDTEEYCHVVIRYHNQSIDFYAGYNIDYSDQEYQDYGTLHPHDFDLIIKFKVTK